jgi:translation elongation factor EF-G
MNKVIEGLNKLNKAELSAEVSMNASGEYILGTCGEVHLHKCIKDLIDDYARIQINVFLFCY